MTVNQGGFCASSSSSRSWNCGVLNVFYTITTNQSHPSVTLGSFNCDIVNRSIYSTVFDIPVALIGILGYLVLGALAQVCRKKAERKTFLLLAALVGLALHCVLPTLRIRSGGMVCTVPVIVGDYFIHHNFGGTLVASSNRSS